MSEEERDSCASCASTTPAGAERTGRATARSPLVESTTLLVVPSRWPGGGAEEVLSSEAFPIVELPVRRPGDVNRHAYTDSSVLARLVRDLAPDVLDIHEEPFSVAARQWLSAVPPDLPVVMYTAQNIDKRFPPPFLQFERAAHRRVAALYPCSIQAASVARGKGFSGFIEVLPLGYDESVLFPGTQALDDDEIVLGLFGRLVPEKGVMDAVEILACVNRARSARLVVVGGGPEESAARARAAALGLTDRLDVLAWQPASELAQTLPQNPRRARTEPPDHDLGGAVRSGDRRGAGERLRRGRLRDRCNPRSCRKAGDAHRGRGGRGARRGVAALVSDPVDYGRRRAQGIELSSSRTWNEVATRQVDLYRRVVAGDVPRLELPRSPRRRRQLAQTEFGPAASTTAGARPFALPVLRRGGMVAAAVAGALDVTAELAARVIEHPPLIVGP